MGGVKRGILCFLVGIGKDFFVWGVRDVVNVSVCGDGGWLERWVGVVLCV